MIFLSLLFEAALALFFLLLGMAAISFGLFESIRQAVLLFAINNLLASFLFGIALISVGLGLLFRLFYSLKKKRYIIRNASLFLEITPDLVESSCKRKLQHLFPDHEIVPLVRFSDHQCIIDLELPSCEEELQKNLVSQVEREIKNLLEKTLDYRGKFLLRIHFS